MIRATHDKGKFLSDPIIASESRASKPSHTVYPKSQNNTIAIETTSTNTWYEDASADLVLLSSPFTLPVYVQYLFTSAVTQLTWMLSITTGKVPEKVTDKQHRVQESKNHFVIVLNFEAPQAVSTGCAHKKKSHR